MLNATQTVQKTTPRDAKHVANQNKTLSIFKVFVMRISASGGGIPPAHNTSTCLGTIYTVYSIATYLQTHAHARARMPIRQNYIAIMKSSIIKVIPHVDRLDTFVSCSTNSAPITHEYVHVSDKIILQ